MKFTLLLLSVLGSILSHAQDDEIKRFLDTLKLGGTYLVGKEFPPFKLTSSDDVLISENVLQDKITFINFWFEACSPCIAEMTALQNLYDKFKVHDNFNFISITYERKKNVDSLKRKYKISYPVYSTSVDSCYQLNFRKAFPTTMIINRDKKISFFTFGGATDAAKADLDFKTYLYPLINCLLECKKP